MQAIELVLVQVEDIDLRAEADRSIERMTAGDTGAEHHDTAGLGTIDAAQQDAAPSAVAEQQTGPA